MKQLASSLIVLLSLGIAAADPLDPAQVPAASTWVVHVDFEAFRSARIGQLLTAEITAKHKDRIDALTEMLGCNIMVDIDSLTLCGPDAKEENAVSLVKGRFDKQKLLTFLKLNPAYGESTCDGKTLYSWVDEKRQKPQVGAFAADDLVVISQTAPALQAALDLLAGKGKALDAEQSRLLAISQVPTRTFIVAAADGVSSMAGKENAAILNNSNFLVFTLGEKEDSLKAHLQLESRTEEAALQIEQFARGMLAFMTLQLNNQPKLQKLVQSCIINRNGQNLTLDLTTPSEDFFVLLKSLEGMHKNEHDSGAEPNEQ